jgi:DNA-binding transcriptional LysR family regulator
MHTLNEMQNFVHVVEAGSISGAAERLGVAKSGVSRRLAELESRLGARLINRTTRRSSLTDAGRAYYEGAVKLLAELEELEARTGGREAELEGTLRLAAPLSFGLCHLAPAIDEFLRQQSKLSVDIDFSDRHVDLVAQGADLAIRIADLGDSSLQARRICPIRIILCASPEYLERFGAPGNPAGLGRHRVLRYSIGDSSGLRIQDSRGRETTVSARGPVMANNGDFLCDMAVAGHGIVALPTFIVWRKLRSGALQRVLPDCRLASLSAWAVYPRTRYLSRRTRVFIDFLAERFGDDPYWDKGL